MAYDSYCVRVYFDTYQCDREPYVDYVWCLWLEGREVAKSRSCRHISCRWSGSQKSPSSEETSSLYHRPRRKSVDPYLIRRNQNRRKETFPQSSSRVSFPMLKIHGDRGSFLSHWHSCTSLVVPTRTLSDGVFSSSFVFPDSRVL